MDRTVLIVDDHAPFRAVARCVLESGGYRVVGEAGTGAQALLAADRTRPDIVLLDIGLPDADGFTVTRQLQQAVPGTTVVLCSVRDAEHYGPEICRSPAAGFLAKSSLSVSALAAILAAGPDGQGGC